MGGLVCTVLTTVLLGMLPARPAIGTELGAGSSRMPFWLGVRSPEVLDVQARSLLSRHANLLVLRFHQGGRGADIERHARAVSALRERLPGTPILIYGWVSRYLPKGCSGDRGMAWLAQDPLLQLTRPAGASTTLFGDVRNSRYRTLAVRSLVDTAAAHGADGVGIDLAVRTPNLRPGHLARRCAEDPAFCRDYAAGMDALIASLDDALPRGGVVFNGIWNFGPGMVEDQERLLSAASGAIVEYFGLEPGLGQGSFARDIAPYLGTMDRLPSDKRLYVFGRGAWDYQDYDVDYRWQRHLYTAYLLGARANTSFKFQSSFQVPAHKGRSGGLDLYADQFLALGAPLGTRALVAGLWVRQWQGGLVAVSPDEEIPLQLVLDRPMYTPEGAEEAGPVTIPAAGSVILLRHPPAAPPAAHRVPLEELGEWPGARLGPEEGGARWLELEGAEDPQQAARHDLALDRVRSLAPFPSLALDLVPMGETGRLLAVAEVDDPGRRSPWVMVCAAADTVKGCPETLPAAQYQLPPGLRRGHWPVIPGPRVKPAERTRLLLDGPDLFEGTPYRFRRWSHLRMEGDWRIHGVQLERELAH